MDLGVNYLHSTQMYKATELHCGFSIVVNYLHSKQADA